MKLNHAQKKYLLNKLDQTLRAELAKKTDITWQTTVVVACEVKVTIGGWRGGPTLNAVTPGIKLVKENMTNRQRTEFAAAEKAHNAFKSSASLKETLMAEFEEQLLFSDGGLEEANALLAAFAKRLK